MVIGMVYLRCSALHGTTDADSVRLQDKFPQSGQTLSLPWPREVPWKSWSNMDG